MQGGPVVELRNITVQFPGVLANDDVSLSVGRGEVFALVGENGAGKSTLMNVLYGIAQPTAGEVLIKGERVRGHSPRGAIERGVGMVHQHFMLVPSFTVLQNITLSREPRRMGVFYGAKAARSQVQALMEEYGLEVPLEERVATLSVGMQQRVEILKTLYRGADILVLDEPTAVLTPQETEELFRVIRGVVEQKGMTVLLITHKLGEVMAISDRVGVMRQGRLVGIEQTKDVNERLLASMMVGREVLFEHIQRQGEPGEPALEVKELFVQGNRGLMAVRGASFSLRRGEVLGVAAVEGNGQSELVEAVTGLRQFAGGEVLINGQPIKRLMPGEIRALGLAHVPEDRLATGISAQATIAENLIVGKHRNAEFAVLGEHLKRSSISRYAEEVFNRFDLRGAGTGIEAGSLSGGNMQKLVIAREFSFSANVLVIAQPTRGVDIGAMEYIHRQIIERRNQGCAVLLVSADLDEITRLSDRVITLFEGEITGEFGPNAPHGELGYYMTGKRGVSAG